MQTLRHKRQAAPQHQPETTLAARGDGIDAQPELVAGRLFQQTRIDLTAFDRLEDMAALCLGYRHRIAKRAIDIQREAGHLLAVGQREFQLPFQNARIGIVEGQFERGFAKPCHDAAVDACLGQPHGHLGAGDLQDGGAWRRETARLCVDAGQLPAQQREQTDTAQCESHVTLLIR